MPSRLLWLLMLVPLAAAGQTKFPVDAKTGRATGAKEMAPAAVLHAQKTGAKLVVIDVRDAAEYKKDTIDGAINIPLDQLPAHLKDFSKDTTLVFT
jgi:Rhodanese-like domain